MNTAAGIANFRSLQVRRICSRTHSTRASESNTFFRSRVQNVTKYEYLPV